MYNPGRPGSYSPRYPSNLNNRRFQHQRLPQTMPHVATFIASRRTNQVQVPFQNQRQPMQRISEYNLPSQPLPQNENQSSLTANDHLAMHEKKDEVQSENQLQQLQSVPDQLLSQSVQSVDKNPTQIPSNQEEANDSESSKMITNTKNEDNQSNDDPKTEKLFKFPKRKINRKEQKKRLNARMRRLVCPKSPLMVFTELYKDVQINVDNTSKIQDNGAFYTASFEVDGQLYVGKHTSKTQAKQKACENFLRQLLEKKMNNAHGKKVNSADLEKKDSENDGAPSKPKGPPQEDFPWPHFASLAMHNLINHWEILPTSKMFEAAVKPKALGSMKKFPQDPENYNPVQLLHLMAPGVDFSDRTISLSHPSLFEVTCCLNEMTFKGQGSTKKGAKKECCIAAIKNFWNFDFHSISVQ